MEEERVKEEARKALFLEFEELSRLGLNYCSKVVATVLRTKGIRIKGDDQVLPKSPYSYYSKCDRTPNEERDSYCDIGYSRAVEDMLKAGFVKCERRQDGS